MAEIEELRAVRERMGLTQDDITRRMYGSYSKSMVSLIERGKPTSEAARRRYEQVITDLLESKNA